MKHPLWVATFSIIVIAALIIVAVHVLSPSPSHVPDSQLEISSLKALTDGQVSFNVSLSEGESEILEGVVLNGTHYSWSDGSQDDPTIHKGETKNWSINVGNLQNGTSLQVIVEAPPAAGSNSVIVEPSPSDAGNRDKTDYVYDNCGGVGLFNEGMHIIATNQDPRILSEDYPIVNDYWKMLQEHETTRATDRDFISIILSRGDQPTGGYTINIESFRWLECYPAKFLFHVNITDPGEGVMVTQALTNPLVLVPIDKLTPGEYTVEVNVTWFILNVDEEGNIYYTPVMTFAPIIWKQNFTISEA
jgi:hypothetical protein